MQPTKKSLTLFLFFLTTFAFSQEGIVSGVLKGNDGLPIPGVSVIIKGKEIGTVTNFDGEYEIKCHVGDILVISYIGMKTREVMVTASMFGNESGFQTVEKTAVKPIKSDAYKNAITNLKKTTRSIPNIEHATRTYNKASYFQYNRIKDINTEKQNVKLTYFNPDIFYEIGYTTSTAFQFVKETNLPRLQTTFSQGSPLNGELAFQGPETGNIFSYGPQLNNLEFDASNYPYDVNGKLVNIAANRNTSKAYNNTLFKTAIKSFHNLFLNISTDYSFLGFNFINKTQKDLYGLERNHSNHLELNYKNVLKYGKKLAWNAFIKYGNDINNQLNINGFQNNLLLNQWITPPSFSNTQGTALPNGSQRSFSPNNYNNPEWLLHNNNNSEKNTLFVSSIQNTLKISDAIKMNSNLNYSKYKNTQNFGLAKNTVGFNNGYLSNRSIDKNNFNAVLDFNYNKRKNNSKIDIISKANYTHENLKYVLHQASGIDTFSFNNALDNTSINKTVNRNTLRLLNRFSNEWRDLGITTAFSNNAYISSIQNNKWFLPTLHFKINLDELFHIYDFSISANTAFDVNDTSLVYKNQSHNSLNITPSQSLNYRAVNDLFVDNTLKLEEKEHYDLNANLSFRLLGSRFNFGFTYYSTKIKKAVFPIFDTGRFELKNVANTQEKGFEISLNTHIRISHRFHYRPSIIFSTYRTKVLKLLDTSTQIPIAGFSTISKNLIVGQPAGVIVGSAYARDTNNNRIIDANGFPLVANNLKIIGDPTPDYNVGFSNSFTWKDFNMSFVIDFQKGGDVWNGTQNVLNYFGTSQQSATDRTVTNYVFNGVNQQGNTNTIPVDFYNPTNDISENRFVRYGFEGVAEDAIVDGSYVNLKSINLGYKIKRNVKDKFIRDMDVSIYASNLLTWSKFRGASPYSSLYNNASAKGLNFFNAPTVSEVGLKINVKI